MKCEANPCTNDAQVNVQYAHPDPKCRWTANLCYSCAKPNDKCGGRKGEFIYKPIDKE